MVSYQAEDLTRRNFLTLGGAVAATTLLPFDLKSAVADDVPKLGSSRRPVMVIGAGGKTGLECVRVLLANGGYGIRAAVRGEMEKEKLGTDDLPADDVDFLTGVDVRKPETLSEAIAGAGAVIFAASASSKGGKASEVDDIGVENVAKECIKAGVERLIIISSVAVSRPESFAFKFTNMATGGIMDKKVVGEAKVRALYKGQDKLSYTIIRPGGLKSGNAVGANNLQVTQGDTSYQEINRKDVAEVAVEAIFEPAAKFTTFEVYNRKDPKPLQDDLKSKMYAVSGQHLTDKTGRDGYKELFAGLKKDSEYDPNNGYMGK